MFELIQVAENTFYIDCPAKIGVYRMPENRVALIDSGNDKDAGRKILKILDANDWTLGFIVNTHSNADHIGGNKFLAGRTGCKVYANGAERAFCDFPILEPSFLFGGYPSKYLRHKFLLAEQWGTEDIAEAPLPPGMEVFPLGGHFFDMVGVKTPDDVYFMADCVSSEALIEKYHVPFIYDVAAYLSTLDFIETLEGELFIPSHTEAAKSMKPLAELNRKTTLETIELIKGICSAPCAFEELLKKLFDKYGLVLDISQYALAGSTIRSYLSYMVDNGILDIEARDNYLLWKSV
ncbi:MAG: MBL fold metallo-hydrolase [Clostridiales Family XIII bacterium]|jgi:glyoxylase-like metal-dependent hydrolase (beta-lactamase superfamily II)|nr:MBL fold metallo-hydrolase [Clostridiales Family XIII bacterium]